MREIRNAVTNKLKIFLKRNSGIENQLLFVHVEDHTLKAEKLR